MEGSAAAQWIGVAVVEAIEGYFQSLGYPVQANLISGRELGAFEGQCEDRWFLLSEPSTTDCECGLAKTSVFIPVRRGSVLHGVIRLSGNDIASLFHSSLANQIRCLLVTLGLTLSLSNEIEASQLRETHLRRRLRRCTRNYRDLNWFSLIKERRTATLIHDCRNILNWAQNSAQWMMNGRITRSQQECLDVISKDLAKLGSLVDLYERIEELGRLRVEQVDLNRLSQEAVQSVASLALRESVHVVPSIDKVPQIVGDQGQLRNMLTRILTSAVSSAEPNSTVHLRVFRRADEIYVRLEISPRRSGGTGISQTRLGVIATGSDSTVDSAVAVMVHLHGGWFTSRQTPGQCNTVIALPLIQGSQCLQTEVTQ